MKKQNKDNKFKELLGTSKGRAILFFGAYFVFFLALMFFARIGNFSQDIDNNYNNAYDFSFDKIIEDNYQFSYEVVIDQDLHLYKGSKKNNSEMFTINDIEEYYSNEGNYFSKKNGLWINIENPYVYKEFFRVENIKLFVENATYSSKTEYESGKNVYSYMLSSATITKIFQNVDIDVEEIPNEIILSVDEEGYVDEIKLRLDSYCKNLNICTNSMVITLKYDEFGNVEDIINPLE